MADFFTKTQADITVTSSSGSRPLAKRGFGRPYVGYGQADRVFVCQSPKIRGVRRIVQPISNKVVRGTMRVGDYDSETLCQLLIS